jgi:4-methoxybenzoate monooxygenase (O-demethylating)
LASGKQPDSFDLGRKAAGHGAFGYGIHSCAGQTVARLEGEIMPTALAERVDQIELDGPPVRRPNNTLRGLSRLPLRVTPS